MKSLMALCTGVMTLVAASSLFVSCYDDSALRDSVNKLDKRLQVVEQLKADLDALTAKVNGLYTLQFDVTSEGKVQYSFDGKSWTTTDIVLAEGCACPAVSLVDNGETVTVKIGDAELTLEKPQEIVFELLAGKLYFESEGSVSVGIKSSGIEDVTVMSAPKGWWAEVTSAGLVEIVAPDYLATLTYNPDTWEDVVPTATASGYVKVHACSTEGKCMVGKIAVEVVEQALVVKAFSGNASYSVVGTEGGPPSFFYGVSTKESLTADVTPLLQGLTEMNWEVMESYAMSYGDPVELSLAEALGTELEAGKQYIAWAFTEKNMYPAVYSMEDLVLAYYTHYDVNISEVEEERGAYNITVNIDVEGLDSYVALAVPALYVDDVDYQKEQIVMALSEGVYNGNLLNESYSGSLLSIVDGTEYYIGEYEPESTYYLFILPLDGRPVEDYTAADVLFEEFSTTGLQSGGSVNITAVEVSEYDGMEFDYNIGDFVQKHVVLNKYSQLGVELSFSSEEWSSIYYQFLDEEMYAACAGDEELLVSLLLEGWPTLKSDLAYSYTWPYIVESFEPGTKCYFVAFAVDTAGKYGAVAQVALETAQVEYVSILWDGAYATNLNEENVLKNVTTFEFTPQLSETVAYYKYIWSNVTDWNNYEGEDDATMAQTIFLSESAVTVTPEELVDGKIVIKGNEFANEYYFAVIPVTEEGPGSSAAIVEYTCSFVLDVVETEGAAFDASEPEVVINLPKKFQYANYEGEYPFWGFEYQEYYEANQFYYNFNYEVTPAPGTEVCAVLVNVSSGYDLEDTAVEKASQLWNGELGSYYTYVTSEPLVTDYRFITHMDDEPAPEVYLLVSWKDADGNHYYKEYALQEELQALYESGEEAFLEACTPNGKQWDFDWSDMGMMMGLEHMYSVFDFGVSAPNYFMAGVDYEAIYGPDAAGMWVANIEGYYEIELTDETSGKIWLLQPDWESGDLVRVMYIEYYDYTGTTCTFNDPNEAFYLNDVKATLRTETVTVMSQGIAM